MSAYLLIALRGVALLLCVTSAGAQSAVPDTLPFRKGQWAVEFPIRSDVGFGFLRFVSRRNALLADARVTISRSSTNASDLPGTEVGSGESQQTTLRFGFRRYRSIGQHVGALASLGVTPGWSRSRQNWTYNGRPAEDLGRGRSFGVFAELGAVYFVTPKISLGMLSGLAGTGTHATSTSRVPDQPARTRITQSYLISFLETTITAAIYF